MKKERPAQKLYGFQANPTHQKIVEKHLRKRKTIPAQLIRAALAEFLGEPALAETKQGRPRNKKS